MRRSVLGLLIACSLVAGCATPEKTPESTNQLTEPAKGGSFGADARECTQETFVFFADPAKVEKWVPRGFTAIRFSVAPGVPEAGAFNLLLTSCKASVFGPFFDALLGVRIHSPTINGEKQPGGLLEVLRWNSSPQIRDGLANFAWETSDASVVAQVKATYPLRSQTGALRQDGADLFRYSFDDGRQEDPVWADVRVWRVLPEGLGFVDLGFPVNPVVSAVPTCSTAAGTRIAEVLGAEPCSRTNLEFIRAGGGVYALEEFSLTQRFEWLPAAAASV